MYTNEDFNYISPENTIMNVSIDYIQLSLQNKNKHEIANLLGNNFLYRRHYIRGEWASDHYTMDGYNIFHSYSIKWNSWNTLKICQPTTTFAYNIHDLLIGHQIEYKLLIVEIPFDITPTNGVTLDDLQLFIESTLYQPYCSSNKFTEFTYVDTYYTKETRNTNSRGMKVYQKDNSFVRCELELKKHSLKKSGWRDITSICLPKLNINKLFKLMYFDKEKIDRFVKMKKVKRNPIPSHSAPFMKIKRKLYKLTKNWLRFTKCFSNWNKYLQSTIEKHH